MTPQVLQACAQPSNTVPGSYAILGVQRWVDGTGNVRVSMMYTWNWGRSYELTLLMAVSGVIKMQNLDNLTVITRLNELVKINSQVRARIQREGITAGLVDRRRDGIWETCYT